LVALFRRGADVLRGRLRAVQVEPKDKAGKLVRAARERDVAGGMLA